MRTKSNFRKRIKSICFFSFFAACAAFNFTACNSNNGKTIDTTSDSSTVVQSPPDTAQIKADWEKFKADANGKIQESNDSIAAFKSRVEKLNGKMKVKYNKEVTLLESKNDTLKMKLDNYKVESKDKWEDFKAGFNHDMDDLKTWLKDSTNTNK